MFKFRASLIGLALTLSEPAGARKNETPVPEPISKPDWASIRRNTENILKAPLYDPRAAQFTWTSGFEWGYIKPALKPHMWAWVACVSVNAKNRMGGYVGEEAQYVAVTTTGDLLVSRADWAVSQCDKPAKVSLQPELIDQQGSGTPSSADELVKLAGLLDHGLISRAEFDAQKAKLLGSAPNE